MDFLKKYRLLSISLMLAGGGLSIWISHSYIPEVVTETAIPVDLPVLQTEIAAEALPSDPKPEEAVFIPSPDKFNMACLFPEDADPSNPMESDGGSIYKELSVLEAQWFGKIYGFSNMSPSAAASQLGYAQTAVLGKYNKNDDDHVKDAPFTWLIPSWKRINLHITNGDGSILDGDSNLKEILSMASVYSYYHDYEDKEAFLQYAKQLYAVSHSYTAKISSVYYCNGCMEETTAPEDGSPEETHAETASESSDSEATDPTAAKSSDAESETVSSETARSETVSSETARSETVSSETARSETVSSETARSETARSETASSETASSEMTQVQSATPSEIGSGPGDYLAAAIAKDQTAEAFAETHSNSTEEVEEILCPGHVDLTISIRINGLTEHKHNLYSIDPIGNSPDNSWPGWTDEMKQYVHILMEQDWMDDYQISISNIAAGMSMDAEEINYYLSQLSNGISQTRRDLIRFALESVGRVPYYWGGKPASKGYSGNLFGSIVAPDNEGRIRKGLDCSGWISWVYWSVTGTHLPAESTAGLVNCGTSVSLEDLQPGDILIRRGEDEGHVVMFLGWGSGGKVLCVHESSGTSNNVAVEEKPFNWQYYRKLIE